MATTLQLSTLTDTYLDTYLIYLKLKQIERKPTYRNETQGNKIADDPENTKVAIFMVSDHLKHTDFTKLTCRLALELLCSPKSALAHCIIGSAHTT